MLVCGNPFDIAWGGRRGAGIPSSRPYLNFPSPFFSVEVLVSDDPKVEGVSLYLSNVRMPSIPGLGVQPSSTRSALEGRAHARMSVTMDVFG